MNIQGTSKLNLSWNEKKKSRSNDGHSFGGPIVARDAHHRKPTEKTKPRGEHSWGNVRKNNKNIAENTVPALGEVAENDMVTLDEPTHLSV